ncbi:DNA-binding transcriptional regulator YiaG [Paraburkholderia sp. UCT70]
MIDAPESIEHADAMTTHDDDAPDQAFARSQVRALLERKRDELPELFRVVFVLRSIEEMSVEETARCLNIPEATVRSRHVRARSMLRESLAQALDLAERDVFEFGGAIHMQRAPFGQLEPEMTFARPLPRVLVEPENGEGHRVDTIERVEMNSQTHDMSPQCTRLIRIAGAIALGSGSP